MLKRRVALDTETTGISDDGSPGDHRIIEIGCVEILDRKISGRTFHVLLNPDRDVSEDAARVHGLTYDQLKDKPHFADIAESLIDFIRGSELLIHNARFDTEFLNSEFIRCGITEKTAEMAKVTDTMDLAAYYYPNHQRNLDNLCSLLDIDNSHRIMHGALLDAQLLAEVYLAMTGGQKKLDLTMNEQAPNVRKWKRPAGTVLPVMRAETGRRALHTLTMIQLAQKVKFSESDGVPMGGSAWSDDFDMPLLEKGKEESKGDFKKRLQHQADEVMNRLLTDREQTELKQLQQKEKELYKIWEDRVTGRRPV